MSVNNSRTPFPTAKYVHLEILDLDEDIQVVIDGTKVVGVIDEFPCIVDTDCLDGNDIEKLMRQGYTVKGFYAKYKLCDNIAVKTFKLEGYPEGSLTIDIFGLIYYKKICIGYFDVEDSKVIPPTRHLDRLEELGIEHKYMYGCETVKHLTVSHD